ncbi:glycosyltransferase family 4 protein [Candidatus Fermentibacteria bacterium]|nr:glycosyltransferase family 4 protein [Candidatus Fermentibacteria bacterium]
MGAITPASLHVDTGLSWRGGQQQVAYLTQALHREGHQVAVVCPPKAPLQRSCRERGVRCFPVTMRGEIDVVAGARIAWLCRRYGFRLLHLHSAHAVTLGIWAKMLMPSLRTIATRRVDFPTGARVFSRWKYRGAMVDRIVCISQAIKEMLLADGVPQNKLVTIHSGVDLDRFAGIPPSPMLRDALGIPPDHFIVGTVAAMAAHKDYPSLLMAAEEVLRTEERVVFCGVGDGPQRHRIDTMARDLGLGERFKFAGFQDDIGSYLRLFDIFVMASRTEGLGTSVIDALAVGVPVVATRVGGIPEIVQEEKNGLLVPPGNAHALASAIHRLITDGDLRARLAASARASVTGFDIAITVEKNLSLYRQLMAQER